MLDAPAVLVGPPGSGVPLLLRSLASASGVVAPAAGTLADIDAADDALLAGLVDREDRGAAELAGTVRPVLAFPPEVRVSALAERFPRARFVLVTRDPAGATALTLAEATAAGESPDEAALVEAWRAGTEQLLDDLDALAPERWSVVSLGHLMAEPRRELRRLCAFLDVPYDQALLSPVEEARRRLAVAAPAVTPALATALPAAMAAGTRLAGLVATPPPAVTAPRPDAALASVSTASFGAALQDMGASLLISTYQTGKLICARAAGGVLNTHFRDFDKPMGLAVHGDRIWLGTRTEVWDFKDMPEVAPKLEPAGTHDACFLPRNRHTTGDIAVHELARAGGELWVVATAFSCLATIDEEHSFVPRWRPPWITALEPGDRCHLNGLCVVDDEPRYVTALGRTDEPGAWRPGKAAGGVLMDVPSSEVVVGGLSMPHSPRWHGGHLWVLESGKGELCVVDRDTGTRQVVAELPGFTRGLAFAGNRAFVGLSQIRESSTFGDLPLTRRLQERLCGVWIVDVARGEIEGFLRFDDLVQEVFDVALLAGSRWPEIAEPGSTAVASSFALP